MLENKGMYERDEEDPSEESECNSNMKYGNNDKEYNEDELKSTSYPTVAFLWVWNFIATLPQTIGSLFIDLKNGDLLARFSFLDAMLQFIVAVATSCHPQEEAYEEEKPEASSKEKDIKPFGGTGRTLRSRTVATDS